MSPAKTTDHTLAEKLRITSREIAYRLDILGFTPADAQSLRAAKPRVSAEVEQLVETFYQQQTAIGEVARVIGDAESLARLKSHMRRYVLGLFDGQYDLEYVATRLRIGLVHMRIGVTPKLYVSAIRRLKGLLGELLTAGSQQDRGACQADVGALDKILMFDLELVFDTYIHGLMEELGRGKEELERYAQSLEDTVAERTRQLAELARKDGLTGLYNQTSFWEELRRELARSQRRGQELSLISFDLDHFKHLNDTQGHKRGDEILVLAGKAMGNAIRAEDTAARYGGDEFSVILPQTSASAALAVAARIRDEFNALKGDAGVTMSVGVSSTGPDSFLDADLLAKQADQAMYAAKAAGGDAIRLAGQ